MIFYALLAGTIILFILLQAVIFPRLFFHASGEMRNRDRGISDINEEGGGHTVIYEPEHKFRRFINHYLISERNGKKILKCEVDKKLQYIDYDIRMFNGSGSVFKVLNVKEIISKEGLTRNIILDDETAYASVAVNEVDGKTVPVKNKRYKVSSGLLVAYFLCCLITEIISVFVVKICISELFGGIFHESFIFSLTDNIVTGIACLAIFAVNVIATLIILRVSSVKKVK